VAQSGIDHPESRLSNWIDGDRGTPGKVSKGRMDREGHGHGEEKRRYEKVRGEMTDPLIFGTRIRLCRATMTGALLRNALGKRNRMS